MEDTRYKMEDKPGADTVCLIPVEPGSSIENIGSLHINATNANNAMNENTIDQ